MPDEKVTWDDPKVSWDTPEQAAEKFVSGSAPARYGKRLVQALNPIPSFMQMIENLSKAKIMSPQEVKERGLPTVTSPDEAMSGTGRSQVAPIVSDIKSGNYAGAAGTVTGMAIPFAAGYAAEKSALPGALQASAEKQYGRVLNPTKQAAKTATAEVVPGMIERGVMSPTLKGLQEKVTVAADQAGAAINDAYNALPADRRLAIQPIWDTVEQVRQKKVMVKGTQVSGRDTLNNALDRVQTKLLDISDTAGTASVESLRSFRQILDSQLTDAGGFYNKSVRENSMLRADKAMADAIRRELAAQFPDIAALNKEFHFWQQAKEVLDATQLRRQGQSVPMGEQLFGAGGFTGGLIKGGISHGLLAGAEAATAIKAFRSTGWRTVSAVTKSRIADALAEGKVARAAAMINMAIKRDPEKFEDMNAAEPQAVP